MTFAPRNYEDDDYTGETFPPATPEERAELVAWLALHAEPFTADQLAAMGAAITGRCEYTERVNTWRYNFTPGPRRERSGRVLAEAAAHAAGVLPEDLSVEQATVIAQMVEAAVAVYDARNHMVTA